MTEMTEARLAELRKYRDEVRRNPPPAALSHVWRVIVADAVDEIDRLRADNERLEAHISTLQSLNNEASLLLANQHAENERLTDECRRYQFAPMGDNHHNAMLCPYCASGATS